MGRVISLKHSRDGKIRSVILKLPSGRVTSRPLQLLVPFEVPEKRRTSVMGMMKTWMTAMLLMTLLVPANGVRTFDEAASDWQNKKTTTSTTVFTTSSTSTAKPTIATTSRSTRVTTQTTETTKKTIPTFPVNPRETTKATTVAQAQEELRKERGGAKEFPQITKTTISTTRTSTQSITSKDDHKHRYPEDHVLDFEEMENLSSEEKLVETKEKFHVDEIHQAAKGKEHTKSDILCSQGGACHNNGLCKDGRCAAVTKNTIVPELSYASQYPGATYCTTSCGGWGRSCWSLGEGCLFHRTYAQVTNSTVFEIFDCQMWKGKTAIKYSRRNPKNLEKIKMVMLNVGETLMETNALGDMSVTLLDAKVQSGNSYQHEKFLKSGESLAIAEKDAPEPALT
ncbi:unnamed protein product, partial [Mesorhabditis belari]|uniref:Phlebovirus glycoprotein G2 fusion domain-containing protein n=1 Tax=Mesorhabditis belari TaxID=2138241 RepID=A0AAF3FJI8_9BILA